MMFVSPISSFRKPVVHHPVRFGSNEDPPPTGPSRDPQPERPPEQQWDPHANQPEDIHAADSLVKIAPELRILQDRMNTNFTFYVHLLLQHGVKRLKVKREGSFLETLRPAQADRINDVFRRFRVNIPVLWGETPELAEAVLRQYKRTHKKSMFVIDTEYLLKNIDKLRHDNARLIQEERERFKSLQEKASGKSPDKNGTQTPVGEPSGSPIPPERINWLLRVLDNLEAQMKLQDNQLTYETLLNLLQIMELREQQTRGQSFLQGRPIVFAFSKFDKAIGYHRPMNDVISDMGIYRLKKELPFFRFMLISQRPLPVPRFGPFELIEVQRLKEDEQVEVIRRNPAFERLTRRWQIGFSDEALKMLVGQMQERQMDPLKTGQILNLTDILGSRFNPGRQEYREITTGDIKTYFTLKDNDPSSEQEEDSGEEQRSVVKRIDPRAIKVDFSHIVGHDKAKQLMLDVVNKIKRPGVARLLTKGDEGGQYNGVLLVGPSGTGKTHFAKAVAKELDATFLQVSPNFQQMFVGTGPQNVRVLEKMINQAEKDTVVVYFDEMDAIGKPQEGISGIADKEDNRTISMLQTLIDGMVKSKKRVIWMGSTNRPMMISFALLSRFPHHLTFGLPQPDEREGMLRKQFEYKKLQQPDGSMPFDIKPMVEATDGFSGRKLTQAVQFTQELVYRRLPDADLDQIQALMDDEKEEAAMLRLRQLLSTHVTPGDLMEAIEHVRTSQDNVEQAMAQESRGGFSQRALPPIMLVQPPPAQGKRKRPPKNS